MSPRALVVSFDRLSIGYLGCYGNEWIETPNFDRLAAQGVTFDRHYADSPDPPSRHHAWWTGWPQCAVERAGGAPQPNYLEDLTAAGVRNWLFAESDAGVDDQVAPPFDNIIAVRGDDGLDLSEAATPFVRLVQRALVELPAIDALQEPALVWLKSRGVPAPWLPPAEIADLYLDEFGLGNESDAVADDDANQAAPSSQAAPVDPWDEPQEVWLLESGQSRDLKYARALYAAYVTHLDRWLGTLLDGFDRMGGRERWLLIVTAAAGEPLGEHGELEIRRDLLREEVVHTPLWIWLPQPGCDGTRRPALVQPVDLAATLGEWFGGELPAGRTESKRPCPGRSLLPVVRLECDSIRDGALLGNADEWGWRTEDFLFVTPRRAGASTDERQEALLFAKPHDRWDQSDVAAQFPEQVDRERSAITRQLTELFALATSERAEP